MATTTAIYHREVLAASPRRQRVMGIVFVIIAVAIWLLFIRTLADPTAVATYGMTLNVEAETQIQDWVVPVLPALYISMVVNFVLGIYQLLRGFKRWTNLVLGVVVALFIFAFLTWSTSGSSISLAGLFSLTLSSAVTLTMAALSGIMSERAGVVNIAIEGMMLSGAMTASLIGSVTHSLWIGLLAGIAAGMLMALIHGILSIKYKTDQIISGTVINIFATGLTSYISTKFLQIYQDLNNPGVFPPIPIPGLVSIPFIGPILFNNNICVYIMFVVLIVLQIGLFNTRWGLRLRSVGEHPKAADTLGINVIRTRYMAVLLSGAMAGFAGSYFSIGSVGRFDNLMTGGRGFIGLAAMIFGNWNPLGGFGAGMLFGFSDALASKLSILGSAIPSEFLLMAPYIATMIVLAGVVGRTQAPAADGTAYTKE
ncbi:MAG TPA: ABC transporter permease [Anaerolineaceae bacterium]|nr:ABC transporter permease [Anaerolineaceae bacterium]